MTLTEKAAYIKGLADGLDFDKTTPEGKILSALLDLVSELTEEVSDLGADVAELEDYVEEIDEDLGDVEDYLDGEDDEDDEYCDGDCENCDEYCDEGEYFEVECPSCGEKVCFDESIDTEDLTCPACGEKFACTFTDDEDEQ